MRTLNIITTAALLFAIGCESTMVGPEYDGDYNNDDTTYVDTTYADDTLSVLDIYLEIDVLGLDNIDGYYTFVLDMENYQAPLTLRALTGSYDESQELEWATNKRIVVNGITYDMIDSTSYTDEFGEGFMNLNIDGSLIGDTLTVYCSYSDGYQDVNFIDSLKVIIDIIPDEIFYDLND
jgi:hypothetical protein